MTPLRKAQLAFTAAMLLFLLSGFGAYTATLKLVESEQWVIHTHEVQNAIGDTAQTLARVARARNNYVSTGKDEFRTEFEASKGQVPESVSRLRELTQDNPKQQEYCRQLEETLRKRIDQFQQSVQLAQEEPSNQDAQLRINLEGVPLSNEITRLSDAMNQEEQGLLDRREKTSRKWLAWSVSLLVFTFLLALGSIVFQFLVLSGELQARQLAEHAARRISNRVLQLQDEERARLARDLHDSVGQSLTGAKMMVDAMARNQSHDPRFKEVGELLNSALSDIRTISHLMHPPGLDEIGFSTAARWFIDGFSRRSGIQVTAKIPDVEPRLPRPIEVALYRVLQEGLSNVHKHSKSHRATVQMRFSKTVAVLAIRDFGVGVPSHVLEGFRAEGASGIGWAGMKGRIEEIGGQFEVSSDSSGTLLLVRVPMQDGKMELADDLNDELSELKGE